MKTTITALCFGVLIIGGQAAEPPTDSTTKMVEKVDTAKGGKPMPPLEMPPLQAPRLVGKDQHYRIQDMVDFSKLHHGDIHRFRVKGATHGTA